MFQQEGKVPLVGHNANQQGLAPRGIRHRPKSTRYRSRRTSLALPLDESPDALQCLLDRFIAVRIAGPHVALAPFAEVAAMSGSSYVDDARYYTGRSHYAMSDFTAAISDFQSLVADMPMSQYADNALYYKLRAEADSGACTAAMATLTQLQSAYPSSTYVATGTTYLGNSGC